MKITKPKHFNFQYCLEYFSRSPKEKCHSVIENSILKAIQIDDSNLLIRVSEDKNAIKVDVLNKTIGSKDKTKLKSLLTEWFDLETDLSSFYKSISKQDPSYSVILANKGLRLIKELDLFEALTWAIIGQQINLNFAYTVKSNFVENYGTKLLWEGKNYYYYPRPKQVLSISDESFKSMLFSKQKAKYLREVAKYCLENPEAKSRLIKMDIEKAQEELMTIKGVGTWTANYVLMRCLHFTNSLPAKDVALQNVIRLIYKLDKKPKAEELILKTKHWNGWESYRTFYLWHYLSKLKK